MSNGTVLVNRKLPSLQYPGDLKNPFGTVLGYGPAGAGKTRSVITLKEHGFSPVMLSTELGQTRGCLSITYERIPIIPISSHIEIIDVIRALRSKPGKVEYDQVEFDSVVLDSITQWGEMPLDAYARMQGWSDLHTTEKGKDPRQAYSYLAEKGRTLYKELFSLHAHLYIIAREGLFVGDADQTFCAPELPGQKLPRELPGWPDATVRLRVIGGKYRMVTQGEGLTPARVRLPSNVKPLPRIVNPNIGALIKYLLGDESVFQYLVPTKELGGGASTP